MELTCCNFLVARFRVAFFFSSRGRHTRCLSDWSSDVCSSDLPARAQAVHASPSGRGVYGLSTSGTGVRGQSTSGIRSEERRVGKEGRFGGMGGHSKEQQKQRMCDRESTEKHKRDEYTA